MMRSGLTGEPELSAGVKEVGDLGGDSTVSGISLVRWTAMMSLVTHRVGAPMIRPSTSLRSLGVRTGYLGLSDPPACILVRISSERVSWLYVSLWQYVRAPAVWIGEWESSTHKT